MRGKNSAKCASITLGSKQGLVRKAQYDSEVLVSTCPSHMARICWWEWRGFLKLDALMAYQMLTVASPKSENWRTTVQSEQPVNREQPEGGSFRPTSSSILDNLGMSYPSPSSSSRQSTERIGQGATSGRLQWQKRYAQFSCYAY